MGGPWAGGEAWLWGRALADGLERGSGCMVWGSGPAKRAWEEGTSIATIACSSIASPYRHRLAVINTLCPYYQLGTRWGLIRNWKVGLWAVVGCGHTVVG